MSKLLEYKPGKHWMDGKYYYHFSDSTNNEKEKIKQEWGQLPSKQGLKAEWKYEKRPQSINVW